MSDTPAASVMRERHLDGWRKFHMTKECAKGNAADTTQKSPTT